MSSESIDLNKLYPFRNCKGQFFYPCDVQEIMRLLVRDRDELIKFSKESLGDYCNYQSRLNDLEKELKNNPNDQSIIQEIKNYKNKMSNNAELFNGKNVDIELEKIAKKLDFYDKKYKNRTVETTNAEESSQVLIVTISA